MSRICLVKVLYYELYQKTKQKDKYLDCKDCPLKNCKERELNGKSRSYD